MDDDDLLHLVTAAITDGDDTDAKHSYRVVARGELDLASSSQLADTLDALIDEGATVIVLDASAVDFVDSSGLRAIIRCGSRISDNGGRLFIDGMSGAVQRVLEISGLIDRYRK